MENFDVHNYQRRFEVALKNVLISNLPNRTKQNMEKFTDYCVAEGLSIPTVVKHLFCLQNIAKWARKSLEMTDKDDIVRIIGLLEKSHYSEHTKHAHKVAVKKFYKWLEEGEDYPKKVSWIKSSLKNKNRLPEELLTVEDVERMINAADNIRDKAMISLLYESGFRIGELLSLRIKHVSFDEYGAKIIANGKTGMRRIRVITSTPYIATLIENHPLRDDPNAPLWVGIGTVRRNQNIHYRNAGKLVRRLAKKTGLKKKVHCHLFRHSRATHLANHLTEAQMNHYFGWVQGSNMPGTYVHLSGRDVDNAILKLHNMKKDDETKQDKFSPKKCMRCEKMNPSNSRFCFRCGFPLDEETKRQIIERDFEQRDASEILDKMLENEEFKKVFLEVTKKSIN